MNIVAINGSHRGDQGHCKVLLDLLGEGIQASGGDYEIITLAKHKINRCIACGKCHQQKHHLECIYKELDDVDLIFDKISSSDLVIYATPVYVFGISGLLKTFLDRMYSTSDVNQMRVTKSRLFFHHVNQQICSKPFVSLICCDNLDAETPKNARNYFRTFSRFMDAPQKGEIIRNAGRLFGYGHTQESATRFPKITNVYAAFRHAGREIAKNGEISLSTQRQANQEIIPVPMFSLLKRIPAFKKVMILKSGEYFK